MHGVWTSNRDWRGPLERPAPRGVALGVRAAAPGAEGDGGQPGSVHSQHRASIEVPASGYCGGGPGVTLLLTGASALVTIAGGVGLVYILTRSYMRTRYGCC